MHTTYTQMCIHAHTEINLASELVILADCCSDPIFSLVAVTAVMILIHMYDGGPDFFLERSLVLCLLLL